jgi:hypothetical protein
MPVPSCVPSVLLAQADCLQSCMNVARLQGVFTYLLCAYAQTSMSIACDSQSLATAAAGLEMQLSEAQLVAAQTYLLALIAGQSTNAQSLANLSAPFQSLTIQELLAINAALLCQIA